MQKLKILYFRYGVVKALPTPLPFNIVKESKEDFYEHRRA